MVGRERKGPIGLGKGNNVNKPIYHVLTKKIMNKFLLLMTNQVSSKRLMKMYFRPGLFQAKKKTNLLIFSYEFSLQPYD